MYDPTFNDFFLNSLKVLRRFFSMVVVSQYQFFLQFTRFSTEGLNTSIGMFAAMAMYLSFFVERKQGRPTLRQP